jgi:hypothetical protein
MWSYDGATEASVPNFDVEVTAIGYVSGGKAFVSTDAGTELVDLATGDTTSFGSLTNTARAAHVLAVAPTP